MLPRVKCPKCGMVNLKAEQICFACGYLLRKRRWRPRDRPLRPGPPALLWVGLICLMLVIGFLACALLAAARNRLAQLPPDRQQSSRLRLALGGGGLLLVGQAAFWLARRREGSCWQLRRAPRLSMAQARPGDTAWLRGEIRCEAPLIAPASAQPSVYYRYIVQERGEKGGWRTVSRDKRSVDFQLEDQGESVYVSCGDILFDAPLSLESTYGLFANHRFEEHAFFVGMPAYICGHLVGAAETARVGAVAEGIPALLTYRPPESYLGELSRRILWTRVGAWAASVAGFLGLAAGLMRV